jgi:hypothetical protein
VYFQAFELEYSGSLLFSICLGLYSRSLRLLRNLDISFFEGAAGAWGFDFYKDFGFPLIGRFPEGFIFCFTEISAVVPFGGNLGALGRLWCISGVLGCGVRGLGVL